MKIRPAEFGFALLIVIWALGFLALLGTQLAAAGRQDTKRTRNLLDSSIAEAQADGAVQHAIFALLDPSEQRWRADGSKHVLASGQYLAEIWIDDENGKVNPNFAPAELLQSLLQQLGATTATAARLAAAIAGWRAGGDQPHSLGAKAPQYAAAGQDYAPPEAPFESLDELGAVLGMTQGLLAQLKPHLTLASDFDPDISTTDKLVAAAVQASQSTASRLNKDAFRQVVKVRVIVSGPRRMSFSEDVVVRLNAFDGIRRHEILLRDAETTPD